MKRLAVGDLAFVVEDHYFSNPNHLQTFREECADKPCRITKIRQGKEGKTWVSLFWKLRNQTDITGNRVVFMACLPLQALMAID